MSNTDNTQSDYFVLLGETNGEPVIFLDTPLKRLRYYDGKFLRAEHLQAEQTYLRNLSQFANRANGAGIVYGLDLDLTGDALTIGEGLAIDPQGRELFVPDKKTINLSKLIEKSKNSWSFFIPYVPDGFNWGINLKLLEGISNATWVRTALQSALESDRLSVTTAGQSIAGTIAAQASATVLKECAFASQTSTTPSDSATTPELYLITVAYAQAVCGQEDVYGRLCEEACVASSERPYYIEGVMVRARPLKLEAKPKVFASGTLSDTHFRSSVASRYFEDERNALSLFAASNSVKSKAWGKGAPNASGFDVPLGVVARQGAATLFWDTWIARRECMDASPKRYWQNRLDMRPHDVFMAQLLQFQTQLQELIEKSGEAATKPKPGIQMPFDAAASLIHDIIGQTAVQVAQPAELMRAYPGNWTLSQLTDLRHQLLRFKDWFFLPLPQRILINLGIVELPSAGYLPVSPSTTLTVNQQIRQLLGDGVDLSFCAVSHDFVPHALEEAQHMQRISLIEGIDTPTKKPKVEVLVPNGVIKPYEQKIPGQGYDMETSLFPDNLALLMGALATTATGVNSETSFFATTASTTESTQFSLKGAGRGEISDNGICAFHHAAQTVIPNIKIPIFWPALSNFFVKFPFVVYPIDQAAIAAISNLTAKNLNLSLANAVVAKPIVQINPSFLLPKFWDAELLKSILEIINKTEFPADADAFQSLWASVHTDRDPFSLERGQSTGIRADFKLQMHASFVLTFQEISLNGTLRVEDNSDQSQIKCWLNLEGTIRNVTRSEFWQVYYPPVILKLTLSEQAIVARTQGTSGKQTLTVSLPNPKFLKNLTYAENQTADFSLEFERTWISSDQARITASLKAFPMIIPDFMGTTAEASFALNPGGGVAGFSPLVRFQDILELPLFQCEQIRNNTALKPGHLLHSLSLAAIERLADMSQGKDFIDVACRQLFPPPQPVPGELTILGVEDWVLFRRRREMVCRYETAPEELIQSRRYRLYHLKTTASELEALKQAFIDDVGEIISQHEAKSVLIVEFDAGIPSLRTPLGEIMTEWTWKERIALGVIASQGAAYDEGDVLAKARLERLADMMTETLGSTPEPELTTIAKVPGVWNPGEVDGVIALVTLDETAICHSVYPLSLTEAEYGSLKEKITKKTVSLNFAGSSLVIEGRTAHPLDLRIDFKGPMMQTGSDDLWTKWKDGNYGTVGHVVAITKAGSGQPIAAQSASIANALYSPITTPEIGYIETTVSIPTCLAATVLIVIEKVETVTHAVYRVLLSQDDYTKFQSGISAENYADKLKKAINLDVNPKFISGTSQLKDQPKLQASWDKAGGGRVDNTIAVAPTSTNQLVSDQTMAIASALGTLKTGTDKIIKTPSSIPGCSAISILRVSEESNGIGVICIPWDEKHSAFVKAVDNIRLSIQDHSDSWFDDLPNGYEQTLSAYFVGGTDRLIEGRNYELPQLADQVKTYLDFLKSQWNDKYKSEPPAPEIIRVIRKQQTANLRSASNNASLLQTKAILAAIGLTASTSREPAEAIQKVFTDCKFESVSALTIICFPVISRGYFVAVDN